MNWYLFSFDGRINRAKWWLSFPIVLGSMLLFLCVMWMLIMSFVVLPEVHADLHGQANLKIDFDFGIDEIVPLLGRAFHHSLSRPDAISLAGNLVGVPLVMWICLATSIKRLHDRDRSGWWIVPFFVVPSFSSNIQDWLGDSIFTFPVGLALAMLCIWGLVEMGFLRGSPRTNLYGPSPLPKQQTRPRSAETRRRATTAWDQDSEIEMIPHIGSPPTGMHVNRGT